MWTLTQGLCPVQSFEESQMSTQNRIASYFQMSEFIVSWIKLQFSLRSDPLMLRYLQSNVSRQLLISMKTQMLPHPVIPFHSFLGSLMTCNPLGHALFWKKSTSHTCPGHMHFLVLVIKNNNNNNKLCRLLQPLTKPQ